MACKTMYPALTLRANITLFLVQDTAQWGSEDGINLVAFGGGVASTVAAFLVHSVFEARSVAVFGVSRRTTEGQLQRARTLAECLGARHSLTRRTLVAFYYPSSAKGCSCTRAPRGRI